MHTNVIIWVIYFKIIWNSIILRLISGLLLPLEMLNKGLLGTVDVLGPRTWKFKADIFEQFFFILPYNLFL